MDNLFADFAFDFEEDVVVEVGVPTDLALDFLDDVFSSRHVYVILMNKLSGGV